jgi:hypothetical protein
MIVDDLDLESDANALVRGFEGRAAAVAAVDLI